MKITPADFETMKSRVAPWDTPETRAKYEAAGFTSKRHRWDLLRYAGLTLWMCDVLYVYLNDSHIDTALRAIVPDLKGSQS